MNQKYRNMLLSKPYKENLVALVIDEAHCVKTWGDKFRVAFAEIGTLRSIIPSGVNILALTATASKSTFNVVVKRLAMVDPVVIRISPDRPNIFFTVQPFKKLQEFSDEIANWLQREKNLAPKTVIFCQSFTSCFQLYASLKNKLKKDFTYPSGYPDLHSFRLRCTMVGV